MTFLQILNKILTPSSVSCFEGDSNPVSFESAQSEDEFEVQAQSPGKHRVPTF